MRARQLWFLWKSPTLSSAWRPPRVRRVVIGTQSWRGCVSLWTVWPSLTQRFLWLRTSHNSARFLSHQLALSFPSQASCWDGCCWQGVWCTLGQCSRLGCSLGEASSPPTASPYAFCHLPPAVYDSRSWFSTVSVRPCITSLKRKLKMSSSIILKSPGEF